MITFDIQDAYFHLALHKDHQKYVNIEVNKELYQAKLLPFGIKNAPFAFTQTMRPLIRFLRQPRRVKRPPVWAPVLRSVWDKGQHLEGLQYLDDFCLYSVDKQYLQWVGNLLPSLMEELGITLKLSKCELEPTQKTTVLGMVIDSRHCIFQAPLSAIEAVGALSKSILPYSHCYKRRLAKLLGKLTSLSLAIAPIRFWTMGLYRVLKSTSGWNTKVQLTHWAKWELKFWSELPNALCSRAFAKPLSSHLLSTDASLTGWGGVLTSNPCNAAMVTRGFWPLNHDKHINLLELWAVYHAVNQFKFELVGKTVTIVTDSKVVMHLLRKFSSIKDSFVTCLMLLYKLLQLHDISVVVDWVPSQENSEADYLSRLQTHGQITDFVGEADFKKAHPAWGARKHFASPKTH